MIQIDKDFSVYDAFSHDRVLNIFSDRRQMLGRWCASIENAVTHDAIHTTVFAGFQQLEYMLPVMERYERMAKNSNKIYIFGQPYEDMPSIENITYVHLQPDHQLCKEWFLVVHHPLYSRALIALETSPPNTPHKDRMFKGLLTNDVSMIEPIHQKLYEQVNSSVSSDKN